MKKILFFLFVLIGMYGTYAQEFSILGDFRVRPELSNGYGKLRQLHLGGYPSAYVAQRARLIMNYSNKSEKLKFGLALQDARTWGSTGQLQVGDGNNFFLYEAWAEVLFTSQFSMKLGRIELNYDDSRILGSVDWLMQARSHDVALFKYESPKGLIVHLGVAYNAFNTNSTTIAVQTPYAPAVGSNYKTMQFLWLHKNFSEAFNLSALVLNNGVEQGGTTKMKYHIAFTQTMGIRETSFFPNIGLGFNISAYYQTGQEVTALNLIRNVNAWNLLGELYYTKAGFTTLLGTEYLSGNKSNANVAAVDKAFNPLYGTNHKFNGFMDYFYVGGRYASNAGLIDPYLTLSYNYNKKLTVTLTGHFFNTANAVYRDGVKKSSYLGTELDLTADYKLSNLISFQGGVSSMFASSTMPIVTGQSSVRTSTYAQWAFIGIIVKPTFFKHNF